MEIIWTNRVKEKIMIDYISFKATRILPTRFKHLQHAGTFAKDGHILEFGVYTGKTLKTLIGCFPNRTIFGFDSFEGIPEDWVCSPTDVRKKGRFKLDIIPHFSGNVVLVKGWFNDTLPQWLSEHAGNIALLHVDSDLYSSCKSTLTLLNERIIKSTVIVFDELCDWNEKGEYENWKEGEWRALNEWVTEYNREITPLARTNCFRGSLIVEK